MSGEDEVDQGVRFMIETNLITADDQRHDEGSS